MGGAIYERIQSGGWVLNSSVACDNSCGRSQPVGWLSGNCGGNCSSAFRFPPSESRDVYIPPTALQLILKMLPFSLPALDLHFTATLPGGSCIGLTASGARARRCLQPSGLHWASARRWGCCRMRARAPACACMAAPLVRGPPLRRLPSSSWLWLHCSR